MQCVCVWEGGGETCIHVVVGKTKKFDYVHERGGT